VPPACPVHCLRFVRPVHPVCPMHPLSPVCPVRLLLPLCPIQRKMNKSFTNGVTCSLNTCSYS